MYLLATGQCEAPQTQKQDHKRVWNWSFNKTPNPERSPEKMLVMPNELKKKQDCLAYAHEVSSPASSTDNHLADANDSDTVSIRYADSARSSFEDLTEFQPRTFLDIVDNAINTHSKYSMPKPPLHNGSPDPYHDFVLGIEILPERHPCNCHFRDLGNRRLEHEAYEVRRTQSTGAVSSSGTKKAVTTQETAAETVATTDTRVGREIDAVTAGRPKNSLLSKFKKLIKPHEKGGQLCEGEDKAFERRDKEGKKQNVTGMNMLAATMGYGMGRF
jgi:hypothetical protein